MAAAQKKRWAAIRKAEAEVAATPPKAKKRHLSPEGRERIAVAATKRRSRAALRKAKAAKAAPKAAAHAVEACGGSRSCRPKRADRRLSTRKAVRRPSSGKSGALKPSTAAKVQEPQVVGAGTGDGGGDFVNRGGRAAPPSGPREARHPPVPWRGGTTGWPGQHVRPGRCAAKWTGSARQSQ